jgi:hypothetical protein
MNRINAHQWATTTYPDLNWHYISCAEAHTTHDIYKGYRVHVTVGQSTATHIPEVNMCLYHSSDSDRGEWRFLKESGYGRTYEDAKLDAVENLVEQLQQEAERLLEVAAAIQRYYQPV